MRRSNHGQGRLPEARDPDANLDRSTNPPTRLARSLSGRRLALERSSRLPTAHRGSTGLASFRSTALAGSIIGRSCLRTGRTGSSAPTLANSLRGLIHSDGCRTINRVRDGRYAYPRYFFTNRSTDILKIFRQACDAAQIAHSSSKPDTISIARREAVAALDAFIGPKS